MIEKLKSDCPLQCDRMHCKYCQFKTDYLNLIQNKTNISARGVRIVINSK